MTHGAYQGDMPARIAEWSRLLETEQGRTEIRRELTASVLWVVVALVSEMKRREAAGENWTDGGPIKSLGTYANTLERLLRTWPDPADGAIDVTAVIEEARERVRD